LGSLVKNGFKVTQITLPSSPFYALMRINCHEKLPLVVYKETWLDM